MVTESEETKSPSSGKSCSREEPLKTEKDVAGKNDADSQERLHSALMWTPEQNRSGKSFFLLLPATMTRFAKKPHPVDLTPA
ncbi:hypothetical protein CEXT_388921 [Caerostris extrusa]|uniref:Uncharacterized protein n=1 Tax=Caerostris extrusa TaxID=172846 RepID=A0AAV4MLE6_CAEEX|nr:hypothetical protein CEXT_388921 [Caerostris extrusa]